MKIKKVIIADKNPVYREGFKRILKHTGKVMVVGEAACSEELLDLMDHIKSDLVFLDGNLPGNAGVNAAEILHKKFPELKIVVISDLDNSPYVQQMKDYGVNGFLSKNRNNLEIIESIIAGKKGNYFSFNYENDTNYNLNYTS